MLLWSHPPFYQNQEQLKHCFLPHCHHGIRLDVTISLPSMYHIPKHSSAWTRYIKTAEQHWGHYGGTSTGFLFVWLASGLRTHQSHPPWKGRCRPLSPCACPYHRHGHTTYARGLKPNFQPALSASHDQKPSLGSLNVRYSWPWKLLTHRTHLWFHHHLQRSGLVRGEGMQTRVHPNDRITQPDLAWKMCSESLITHMKYTLQVFTDSNIRYFWIFSYPKWHSF